MNKQRVDELLLKQIIDDEIKIGTTFKNFCLKARELWIEVLETNRNEEIKLKKEQEIKKKQLNEQERDWLLKGL